MNWTTFFAMLARDARVARRNLLALLMQTLLQPMLVVIVFGKILTAGGMMAASYKGMLAPGIMGMSMVLTGVQAVAMPLIAEFQFTREIEDRLLAPMKIEWLAVEKVLAGVIQAVLAGAVVVVTAKFVLGSDVNFDVSQPFLFVLILLLVALFSAAGGLTMGCSVGQRQIGLMFSMVLAPMISFGCVYYPWSVLSAFPWLQKAVLLNPLVYASEGLRATLTPQYPHMSATAVVAALIVIDVLFMALGLRQFQKKAIS
jgi:ABC-2 type transport system permease protein